MIARIQAFDRKLSAGELAVLGVGLFLLSLAIVGFLVTLDAAASVVLGIGWGWVLHTIDDWAKGL